MNLQTGGSQKPSHKQICGSIIMWECIVLRQIFAEYNFDIKVSLKIYRSSSVPVSVSQPYDVGEIFQVVPVGVQSIHFIASLEDLSTFSTSFSVALLQEILRCHAFKLLRVPVQSNPIHIYKGPTPTAKDFAVDPLGFVRVCPYISAIPHFKYFMDILCCQYATISIIYENLEICWPIAQVLEVCRKTDFTLSTEGHQQKFTFCK